MNTSYFWKIPAAIGMGWIGMFVSCFIIGFVLGIFGSENVADALINSPFMGVLTIGLWVFWGIFSWKKMKFSQNSLV
jgi:hypothetical protein